MSASHEGSGISYIPHIGELPEHLAKEVEFDTGFITVTSAPEYGTGLMDIREIIKNPEGFKGAPYAHDVVDFGQSLSGLRGTFDPADTIFADRDRLPEYGIHILSDHYPKARSLVADIDALARRVIENNALYKDPAFCAEYFAAAKEGFEMVRRHSGEDVTEAAIPVTLERAGIVATRLLADVGLDDIIPGEASVVTKRFHRWLESAGDISVSVRWRDLADVDRINNGITGIADFVNPASGASALALLISARRRGAIPAEVRHFSFMSTLQGIDLSRRVLGSAAMGGIRSKFYTLGASATVDERYYLAPPDSVVADAGDALEGCLPSWYKQ